MDSDLDLKVLNLQAALATERLKNCDLLRQALDRRADELITELKVLKDEIDKLQSKPQDNIHPLHPSLDAEGRN